VQFSKGEIFLGAILATFRGVWDHSTLKFLRKYLEPGRSFRLHQVAGRCV